MKSYTIIGLGRFGSRLAEQLYENGNDVLVIDTNETLINSISESVTRAVVADAKNKDVLKNLGVSECDAVIVALASDLASSILITMNLKSLGVKKIVCKSHDDTHSEILKKLGADQVVIPERVVADKLATTLSSSNILELIELSDEFGIFERKAPLSWTDKKLHELNLRVKYGINIIAVKNEDNIKVSLTADYVIKESDILILLGEIDSIDKIKRIK